MPVSLFDRIVVVDWSAHTGPKRGADSIWVCSLDARDEGRPDVEVLENIPTRLEAHARLAELIAPRARTGPAAGQARTLLAIDVALGYPRGTARAAGLIGSSRRRPWESMWQHLAASYREGARNRPEHEHDRWTVATELNRRLVASGSGLHFWGCPPRRASTDLTTRRPPAGALRTDRACEVRLREAGLRPFSVWQLLGAGAVGSQTLTAIPMLEALRHDPGRAGRTVVWPFETGVDPSGVAAAIDEADVVIAEIWPGTLSSDVVDTCRTEHSSTIKDARQVTALARHLRVLDRERRLLPLFCPVLDAATSSAVIDEEGWVLGLPLPNDDTSTR